MSLMLYPPLASNASTASFVQFGGNTVDSFGRLRTAQPYTLFDSQARYAKDSAYSYSSTGTGAASTYNNNQSSVSLTVGTTAGTTIAQTYRVFPYQPGKSLLTLQTFTMAAAQPLLTQRIGYFNTNNGVYLEQAASTLSFVIRTYTGGTVDNSRTVPQSQWNVDKFNGTGPSGVTLDVTKTQILWFDFEWLGVGNVRCGFVVNGTFYTAHVFQNANFQTVVYMQTAILPLRYEISSSGTTTGATLQQICSSVISEGGYEQISQQYIARQQTAVTLTTADTYYPLVAFQLNSSYLGAVVIPAQMYFQPFASGTNYYEVILVKNATLSNMTTTGALCGGQVDLLLPTTATAPTSISPSADSIVMLNYASAGSTSSTPLTTPAGFNWDLQLGVTVGGTSDTYTLAARSTTLGNTCLGSIAFYNLTV